MSNGITTAPKARIPAWKRLGLKLKYAKETPDEPNTSHAEQRNGLESSISGYENGISQSIEESRVSKKRKFSPEVEQIPPEQPSIADFERIDSNDRDGATSSLPSTSKSSSDEELNQVESVEQSRSRSRRKSVTFTKDTKQEDGISAKSLTGKHPKSDAFESITESTEATPLPSKEKKKRKRQQAEASETADSTQKPQYLEYLERFENDRDHWKFNKHNQSNLLKHIFDIKRIPVSYNKAIAGYLSGLQGNEARERLVESATEVLKDVAEKEEGGLRIESMESVQARRDAYAASLRRQIERVDRFGLSEHDKHELEDMKDEVERGRRAENILSQMLQQQSQAGEAAWMARSSLTNGTTSSDGSQVPTAGTASQGSVSTTSSSGKKRKSRTPASSSDDSDSDIEGEDRGAPRPRIENAVTKATYGTARGEPKVYQPLETMATGKKIIFDEALLDDLFPRPKTASVGTRTAANAQDSESDSGSESESDSDSSDSESDSE